MYRYTNLAKNLSLLVAGVLLCSTLGQLQATDKHESPHHFNRPELNSESTPCAAELAAYMNALANLENAQMVADVAWEALQDCYSENPPPPPTVADLAGTVSILEK